MIFVDFLIVIVKNKCSTCFTRILEECKRCETILEIQ